MLTTVVGLLSLLMSSCTTYSYTSRSTSVRLNTMQSENLGAEVDVDFSRKVTGSSEAQVLKIDAINEAQYKCINENNIDVIVDPIYKIEFNMSQKRAYKATVVGYAGMYKQVKTGVDAVVEKNYKVEDIEKYKLITDPTFYQYYYQKDPVQGGDVTNYFINTAEDYDYTSIPAKPTSVMLQTSKTPAKKQEVNMKVYDYRKSKQLRNAGIGMFASGLVLATVFTPLSGFMLDEDVALPVAVTYGVIGGGCFWSGVACWAVGSKRMKQASASQLAIGGTKDGLGMRLTF